MRALLAIVLAILAGCERELSPEEQARQDARDIAMVEAAQTPPLRPVTPQPITDADIATASSLVRLPAGEARPQKLFACAFVEMGDTAGKALLRIDRHFGLLKLDRQPLILASDTGSPANPADTFESYTGRGVTVNVRTVPAVEGGPAEPNRWEAALTVRDEYDRAVYSTRGTFDCGA